MRCAVYGCNNNNMKDDKFMKENVSYFSFPKDSSLLKRWIHFCKRSDPLNTKMARVCNEHFESGDFERNLQYEMGFVSHRRLILKPGCVPSIYMTDIVDVSQLNRKSRIKAREDKRVIDSLLQEVLEVEDVAPCIANESVAADIPISSCENCILIGTQIDEHVKQIQKMQNEIDSLKKNQEKLQAELKLKEVSLTKSRFESKNMEKRLASIFTFGQIRKLKNGSKLTHWSEVDVARSITLYSASARAYRLLQKNRFPLPSVRTLQRWAQKIDISPGILKPVVKILKAATQLDVSQKVCVLSFDEMKIKKAFCYDKTTDTTLAPANYVQVAMLRGLMSNWKQPIFYSFDCKMTTEILKEILRTTEACGYTVVAMVSDLGGGNRGLYGDLNITQEKPWFLQGKHKIFVFADVPHLLKLLRNHYLDSGFLINNKEVKKDTIAKLLSCTATELTITHKISECHINVRGAERQKVKLATKLFSHTIAKAIERAGSLNLLGDNWEECYHLFKLVDDWFDVMNVRVPNADARERVHAYGLAIELQNGILMEMSETISKMRVIGKSTLLPFQKGIIQSNTAVKLLFEELKNRFGFKYILTYRLNQDVLENTFGLLRAKGGLHDHPDRQEFKYRLRSHILGHNEGVISDNANVSLDDTPDLVAPLTGTILKSIAWEPEEEESFPEQEELNSLAYDGLENLAGYICHKLPVQTLAQPTNDQSLDTNSWVSHVSEGGLLKPTPEMMVHMTALESIFTSFNGEELVTCSNYLQNLLDLAEDIKIDQKIKTLFFRARMFFRIRTLNRAIIENAKSKKRKFNKIIT